MPRPPTRFSRMSVGFVSSAESLVDRDAGDTGDVFSVTGGSAFGEVSTTVLTATTSLAVGGGTTLEKISAVTVAADFGSVTSIGGGSTITVGVAGVVDGDLLYAQRPSIWSGAYGALTLDASSGDTTGEVNLTANNSGITAIDSASAVVNILHINF